jgi:hypothetical protein
VAQGKRSDLSGRVFGNLTVTDLCRRRNIGKNRTVIWLCICTCGARVWKEANNLKRGRIRSCSYQHRWESDDAQ